MSTELDDLYQEVILDHGRKPRNFRKLDDANRQAEGLNPLCGDHFRLYLKLDGDHIADVAFEGSGCAISKASASLMTSALKGQTVEQAEKLFERFHRMVTEGPQAVALRGAGQAGRALRGLRVPHPREVREPGLAHARARPPGRGRRGDDGVSHVPARTRRAHAPLRRHPDPHRLPGAAAGGRLGHPAAGDGREHHRHDRAGEPGAHRRHRRRRPGPGLRGAGGEGGRGAREAGGGALRRGQGLGRALHRVRPGDPGQHRGAGPRLPRGLGAGATGAATGWWWP